VLSPQQYAAPPGVTAQACRYSVLTRVKKRTTMNAWLVAPVSVAAVATRVYPVPKRSSRRSVKVATPPTAFTVVTPESAAEVGFDPSARVTALVALVTVRPEASWTATLTGSDIGRLGSATTGCTWNASCAGTGACIESPHPALARAAAIPAARGLRRMFLMGFSLLRSRPRCRPRGGDQKDGYA